MQLVLVDGEPGAGRERRSRCTAARCGESWAVSSGRDKGSHACAVASPNTSSGASAEYTRLADLPAAYGRSAGVAARTTTRQGCFSIQYTATQPRALSLPQADTVKVQTPSVVISVRARKYALCTSGGACFDGHHGSVVTSVDKETLALRCTMARNSALRS